VDSADMQGIRYGDVDICWQEHFIRQRRSTTHNNEIRKSPKNKKNIFISTK
jgi:hypothetical protein